MNGTSARPARRAESDARAARRTRPRAGAPPRRGQRAGVPTAEIAPGRRGVPGRTAHRVGEEASCRTRIATVLRRGRADEPRQQRGAESTLAARERLSCRAQASIARGRRTRPTSARPQFPPPGPDRTRPGRGHRRRTARAQVPAGAAAPPAARGGRAEAMAISGRRGRADRERRAEDRRRRRPRRPGFTPAVPASAAANAVPHPPAPGRGGATGDAKRPGEFRGAGDVVSASGRSGLAPAVALDARVLPGLQTATQRPAPASTALRQIVPRLPQASNKSAAPSATPTTTGRVPGVRRANVRPALLEGAANATAAEGHARGSAAGEQACRGRALPRPPAA
jgi:hypothetical protein